MLEMSLSPVRTKKNMTNEDCVGAALFSPESRS